MFLQFFLCINLFFCLFLQGMDAQKKTVLARYYDNNVALVNNYFPSDLEDYFVKEHLLGQQQLWYPAITFQCNQSLNSAFFNKDETKILLGSEDKTAQIWDTEKVKRVRCFRHPFEVKSACFNKDETKVLTRCSYGAVRMWDVESEEEIKSFASKSWGVQSVCFNKDETKILTADEWVRLWSVETGREIKRFGQKGLISSAQFNSDETKILALGTGHYGIRKRIRIFNSETKRKVVCIKKLSEIDGSVCFNKAETKLLVASDKSVYIWDLETEQKVKCFMHTYLVQSARFNKDETKIIAVTFGKNADVYVWDVETEKVVNVFFHQYSVIDANFNNDDTEILTASNDGAARIWNINTGRLVECFVHSDSCKAACFSKDETKILTASYDRTACIWQRLDAIQWSLKQFLLCKLIFTWLIVEKPDDRIYSVMTFITKIARHLGDKTEELKEIWNTFDDAVQKSIWNKIKYIINAYGK